MKSDLFSVNRPPTTENQCDFLLLLLFGIHEVTLTSFRSVTRFDLSCVTKTSYQSLSKTGPNTLKLCRNHYVWQFEARIVLVKFIITDVRVTSGWLTGRFDLDYGVCEGIVVNFRSRPFEIKSKAFVTSSGIVFVLVWTQISFLEIF